MHDLLSLLLTRYHAHFYFCCLIISKIFLPCSTLRSMLITFYLLVIPSIVLPIYLLVIPSIVLSIYLLVIPSIVLPIYLLVIPSIVLPIYLLVIPSIVHPIYLLVIPSIVLPIYLCVILSFWLISMFYIDTFFFCGVPSASFLCQLEAVPSDFVNRCSKYIV